MGSNGTPTMISLPRVAEAGDEWSHGAAARCGGENCLGARPILKSGGGVVDGGVDINVGA